MKRLLLMVLFTVAAVNISFSQDTEVSKKQDVSVFGVYSSYNMPSAAVMYFDDHMIGVFNSMKRFKVIGYQYRLDDSSAVKFIEHIKGLKEKKALNNQKYLDEDLGVVIIPGAEFDKLVNSFFIVIPSISGWRVTSAKVKKQYVKNGEVRYRMVLEHKAEVSISVKILNADGDLMDVYNNTVTKKSELGAQKAYRKAIDSAIGGLNMFLRKMDEFKLKTKVLQNLGSKVYLQLGKDLGVEPGYEFILKKKMTIGEGFTTSIDAGMVRVKTIGDNYSVATIIKGAPQANDQLIESAMSGGRVTFYSGMSSYNSDLTNLIFSSGTFFSTNTFAPKNFSLDIGVSAEMEMGYALLTRAAIGVMINDPLAFYADLGVGYEIYMGSVSLVPEIDLSIAGTYIGLGDAYYNSLPGTASLMGIYYGIKPRVSFNIQVNQKFKLRFYGSYALYLGGSAKVNFNYDDPNLDSQDITDSISSTVVMNGSAKSLNALTDHIDLSGLGAGLELVFRF